MSAAGLQPVAVPGATQAVWVRANRALVAKSIAELCYEQALACRWVAPGRAALDLASGVGYRFRARRSIWDFLLIDPASLLRSEAGTCRPVTDAGQFLIDAAADLQVADVTLGNLLHEVANTLAADVRLLARQEGRSAERLADLPDERLQGLLDGHPKALASKGRIGWGEAEFAAYATESAAPVRLCWLGVRRDAVTAGFGRGVDPWRLPAESMSVDQLATLRQRLEEAGARPADFLPLPVHPWQWSRHVRHNYQGEIAAGRLIHVGELGEPYLPLLSLRTLSNARRPQACHLKLPLTVLNTSCFRGITGRYMRAGPALSAWLADTCATDAALHRRGTRVLQEIAGIHYPHPHHEQVAGSPYRYREMLGAVWRQSPRAVLSHGQRHLVYAALLHRDSVGAPLAGVLIRRSGLSIDEWLGSLFEATVVPLYHLLCRYGLALVAHAQNLTLILDADRPVGMALKDFHGDLRRVALDSGEPGFPELDMPPQARDVLTALPPHYLVHDLVTGHFVTVLRFLSALLWTDLGYDERRFYRVLGERLHAYQAQWPGLAARFRLFDLFRPRIERVCINRVRLRVGYDDSAERPVPMLGGELDNPLWTASVRSSAKGVAKDD